MQFRGYKSLRFGMAACALASLASCSKTPLVWDWDQGPPPPLSLSSSSAFVAHGKTATLRAAGGVKRYSYELVTGTGTLSASGDEVTYTPAMRGLAENVVIRVTDGYDATTATLTVPASGSIDMRCGRNGNAYQTIDLCAGCDDAAKSATVDATGRLVLVGTTRNGGTPDFFAVRLTGETLTTDSTFASGARIFDAAALFGAVNNSGDTPISVRASPDGSYLFTGRLAFAGHDILGRLLNDGSLDSNFSAGQEFLGGVGLFLAQSLLVHPSTGLTYVAKVVSTSQIDVSSFTRGAVSLTAGYSQTIAAGAGATAFADMPFLLAAPGGNAALYAKSSHNGATNPVYTTFYGFSGTSVASLPLFNGGASTQVQVPASATGVTSPTSAASNHGFYFGGAARQGTVWGTWVNTNTFGTKAGSVTIGSGADVPSLTGTSVEDDGFTTFAGTVTNAGVKHGFMGRLDPVAGAFLVNDPTFDGTGVSDPVLTAGPGSHSFHTLVQLLDGRYVVAGESEFTPDNDILVACIWP